MPRLKPDQNPAYRLHKASGQATVAIEGRTFYLGSYDSPESRTRYHELVGQWRLRQRQLVGDESAQLTLSRATTLAADAAKEIETAPNLLSIAEAMGA